MMDLLDKNIIQVLNDCSQKCLEREWDVNLSLDYLTQLHENRLKCNNSNVALYVNSFLSKNLYSLFTSFVKLLYACKCENDNFILTEHLKNFMNQLKLASENKLECIIPFGDIQHQSYKEFISDCVYTAVAHFVFESEFYEIVEDFLPFVEDHSYLIMYYLMRVCYVDSNHTDFFLCMRELSTFLHVISV